MVGLDPVRAADRDLALLGSDGIVTASPRPHRRSRSATVGYVVGSNVATAREVLVERHVPDIVEVMSERANGCIGTGIEKLIEIAELVESDERDPTARYANLDGSHR